MENIIKYNQFGPYKNNISIYGKWIKNINKCIIKTHTTKDKTQIYIVYDDNFIKMIGITPTNKYINKYYKGTQTDFENWTEKNWDNANTINYTNEQIKNNDYKYKIKFDSTCINGKKYDILTAFAIQNNDIDVTLVDPKNNALFIITKSSVGDVILILNNIKFDEQGEIINSDLYTGFVFFSVVDEYKYDINKKSINALKYNYVNGVREKIIKNTGIFKVNNDYIFDLNSTIIDNIIYNIINNNNINIVGFGNISTLSLFGLENLKRRYKINELNITV